MVVSGKFIKVHFFNHVCNLKSRQESGRRKLGSGQKRLDDPGGHGRFAAVDGWACTRPCGMKAKTFYFVCPKPTIFVPDTEKCPFPWLFLLRDLLMIY